MWSTAIAVNTVLLSLALIYFIYAIFAAILTFAFKELEISFIVVILLTLSEIALSAIAE